MKLTKLLFISVVLLFPFAASADNHDQSNNNPGALKVPDKTPDFPSCWTHYRDFLSADDVFSFYVERTEGTPAGILRVSTQDCCIAGDKWQSEIVADKPRWRTDVAIGDGSISAFTGEAYVAPFKAGLVEVTYDSGTDVFPAGMYVQFCYSRERKDLLDELTITPIP